jgi:hypothetical protein
MQTMRRRRHPYRRQHQHPRLLYPNRHRPHHPVLQPKVYSTFRDFAAIPGRDSRLGLPP